MSDRLSQVSGHLSNNHPRGLLAGEVAIITGACVGFVKLEEGLDTDYWVVIA